MQSQNLNSKDIIESTEHPAAGNKITKVNSGSLCHRAHSTEQTEGSVLIKRVAHGLMTVKFKG